MHSALREAAQRLQQAQQDREACAPIRDLVTTALNDGAGDDSVALAYQIQQCNVGIGLEAGRRPVGRKIGLTSKSVQRQLGVGRPDFGMLFADMARGDGEVIAFDEVLQPKVEVEIALVLERDLPHEHHTFADIVGATAYALPAIEVVGSRVANWDISIEDTIADNASCGLFVLGSRPQRLASLDLVNCGMRLMRRGEPVSTGAGAACLNNPLNAAVWLANAMVRYGNPLKAGDIVMTGALGPMVEVAPGDVFQASIEGFGSVSTAFSAPQIGVKR